MANQAAPRSSAIRDVSTQEAAWLTELSTKTINATIDRGELKSAPRRNRSRRRVPRRLGPADVFYLVLRKELSSVLSADAKTELYEELVRREWPALQATEAPRQKADSEIRLAGGLVRIELKSVYQRLAKRWLALENASSVVVSDPEIRGGEPIIRGTRVPVYLVADLVEQGAKLREVLEDYPALTASMLRSALAYAQTHPKRGRPRKAPWR
jgi:uncharacterized protein (DUF433 family)